MRSAPFLPPRSVALAASALLAAAVPASAAEPLTVVSPAYSLDVEGFFERTRFAPDRTFGVVTTLNAFTGAREPLRPYARFDTNGTRYGAEAILRMAPFDLFGAPVRLFGSLMIAREDSSTTSRPDARSVLPLQTGPCLPSFGLVGAGFSTHCTSFGATPNRSSLFDFDYDGRVAGGAIGIERTIDLRGLRATPSLGLVVDRTRRTEQLLVLDNPGAPSVQPDDRIDAAVHLRSTFVGARLGLSTALPLTPTFEWINRFGADLGVTQARLSGTSRYTRPSFPGGGGFVFPAVDLVGQGQTASAETFSIRLSAATGFTWRPTDTVSINLLGTAGWRSREPYAVYPDIVWPAGGFLREGTPLRVGWDSQWSYGVRGGISVRF